MLWERRRPSRYASGGTHRESNRGSHVRGGSCRPSRTPAASPQLAPLSNRIKGGDSNRSPPSAPHQAINTLPSAPLWYLRHGLLPTDIKQVADTELDPPVFQGSPEPSAFRPRGSPWPVFPQSPPWRQRWPLRRSPPRRWPLHARSPHGPSPASAPPSSLPSSRCAEGGGGGIGEGMTDGRMRREEAEEEGGLLRARHRSTRCATSYTPVRWGRMTSLTCAPAWCGSPEPCFMSFLLFYMTSRSFPPALAHGCSACSCEIHAPPRRRLPS